MPQNQNDFCSIIITHYAMNGERSETMRASLNSLIENTKYPYELIVVDNGQSIEDSEFLLKLANENKIHVYVRNGNNMHFGYARNQGLALSQGDYICIADNDIYYKPGWLEKCIEALNEFRYKNIYATPFDYPTGVMRERYDKGVLKKGGVEYRLNSRAGSNCFVIRRFDFKRIGGFGAHRIAGSKWTDAATRLGYDALVIPGGYAIDLGLRRGYNLSQSIPIKLDLQGQEFYFNRDEFLKSNPDKKFIKQRYLICN